MALRVAVTAGYGWVLIWSFARIAYADATALSFTTVIWVAVLAPLIDERGRYVAAMLGLAGALLIIRPGFNAASVVYGAVLLGTSTNGLALIFNRLLIRDDSPTTVMLYVNVGMLAMFSPGAFEPLPSITLWP
jgi:drug/metabolite transporter (DMT)-like permease